MQALTCWNWKCALLSATARSLVYLAALARTGAHGGFEIVLVEMVYVSLTAGLYAGMQQHALGFSSRLLGNLTVVLGVPGLSLVLDWFAHYAVGAAAPARATLAVSLFAGISALFHLYVMRRGAFLTGHRGDSLRGDFRRMPRLVFDFIQWPIVSLSAMAARLTSQTETETA